MTYARVADSKIKVLFVDQRPADDDGLRDFLKAQPDFDVLSSAPVGQDVVESVQQLAPVVIVVRVGESMFAGIETSFRIRLQQPDAKVVIVSPALSSGNLMLALEAGVHGLVVADAGNHAVAKAVRAVPIGAVYLSNEAAETLVANYVQRNATGDQTDGLERLSKREREVLQRLVDGESAASIARGLELSPKTVSTYRRRLMQKLGVTSTPALVKLAVKHGLTTTA